MSEPSRVDHWATVRHRVYGKLPTIEIKRADMVPDIGDVPPGPFHATRIARAVAAAHHITVEEMFSERRHRHLSHARWHAQWEIRQRTKLSLPQIAKFTGVFDHSSVVHGLKRHEERLGLRSRRIVVRPPKGGRPALNEEQTQRALHLWRAGLDTKTIADRLNRSEAAVANSLHQLKEESR
jgi:hypothetical protein